MIRQGHIDRRIEPAVSRTDAGNGRQAFTGSRPADWPIAKGPLVLPSRGDRTSIELFSGSFGEWTKSLIAIAQALAT